ncbi:MAG: MBL fold metallo-hydrolase [Mariniblastus sp.]
MPKNHLTITGYSTALFSSWYFVDEMALLFDCGDGVCAGLLQKSRKIRHVFVSHADRDHIAGLLQFSQLNSRPGLKIYYPKDSGSFPNLAAFTQKFDPQVSGAEWIPIGDGDEIEIRNDMIVRAMENRHVVTSNGQLKSLSFFVDHCARKLRPELAGKSGSEIAQIRKDQGEEAITIGARSNVMAYSADTPIETDGRWNDVGTLIHEATFLTDDEIDPDNPRRNKHSSLDQVLKMVARSNVQRLILGHFSSRYDDEQIDAAIIRGCEQMGISIPVYRVLPGQRVADILGQQTVCGNES